VKNWIAENHPEIFEDKNIYGWHANQERRSEKFYVEIKTEQKLAVDLPDEVDGIKIIVTIRPNFASML